MKTPADKTIAFMFISQRGDDPALRWFARLTFQPGADGGTMLPIEVIGCGDEPVPEGVFEFAGRRLPVRGGAASILYADFVKGKHKKPIWLHREGMPSVPGGLTFA